MKKHFFNLDLHISVIADLKQIFENLGHSVTSWSLSGHNWVFDREPSKVDIINSQNWRNLDQKLCDEFYERYKDELKDYDGFIVTFPPAFSLLFERFNKPIIIHAPIRYETPFSNDAAKWNWFNDFIHRKYDEGLLYLVANSEYDREYAQLFTDRLWDYIPNLCEYTNAPYNPEKEQFLFSSRLNIESTDLLVNKSQVLPKGYKWTDLAKYKGIVHIPYNVSTMSIFEQYTANIPMFFPTDSFMKELRKNYPQHVLCESTWNQTFGYPSKSIISIDDKTGRDPNDYQNLDKVISWVEDGADFYNQTWMPYIRYFDSFEGLSWMLKRANTKEISEQMRKFNVVRKQKIYDKWSEILCTI